MTLSESLDLPKLAISDIPTDDRDRFDTLEIVIADSEPVDDDHPEPILSATPVFIEFDDPARLDPRRAGLIWELSPPRGRTIRLRSPLASLLFHLLPLIGMITFPLIATEPPEQIPVQLVFEQPPPPPPQPAPQPKPRPQQQPKMETGRLASVDMGEVKPETDLGRTPDPVRQPSAGDPQPNPTDTQTATATTPPMPMPKPAPPKDHQSAFQLPKPSGAHVTLHDQTPHAAPHIARYAGMAASRDEYLAYLVALTRQHIDLLPLSYVGDRRGETVISVTVYDNGTIGPLGVLRSSGYPDIDRRIEDMVAAVHKFPPLPQWYQGNAVQLELTLKFPEALERSE